MDVNVTFVPQGRTSDRVLVYALYCGQCECVTRHDRQDDENDNEWEIYICRQCCQATRFKVR